MLHHRLLLPTLLLSACSLPSVDNEQDSPPNIVVIFADDLGWGDLGCYQNPLIKTPELDRIAKQGMRFTDFHSASPACTASRYSLLTGRYPDQSGFGWVLNPGSKSGINKAELTLAEMLKAQGYATAIFGKWHLGDYRGALPLDHGFDEWLGLPYSNDMLPDTNRGWPDLPLYQNNHVVALNPYQATLTRRYTEAAVDFITRNQQKPFFLYLPYAMPHVPLHPGASFAGKSARGLYGDVVEEIDWSAGVIANTLQELELAENTLFVFTSDNGPWIIKGDHGGSSGPFLDGKGSTWEGGHRVPAIAWWPETIRAGSVCDELSSTLDIFPTAASLVNAEECVKTQLKMNSGLDLMPLFRNEAWPHERILFIHGLGNQIHGVRQGDWKLLIKTNSQTKTVPHGGKIPVLFNLAKDPGEKIDLSEKYPEVVERLQELINSY